MYHGDALGGQPERGVGEQNVIVDEGWAVAYFHKEILTHHASFQLFGVSRTLVVMEEVLGYPYALSFPITPDSHGAVMNIIAAEGDVDGGVHLDTGDFCSAKLHHVVDMMDVVVFNDGEYSAHPSADTVLLAVVDVAAADDMAAHFFFKPSVILTTAYGVPLHLGRTFDMLVGKIMLVVRIQIFAQGDAGTFAVADITVLDDPAFGPVRADHSVLKSRRRRPGGGCLFDAKIADRDIVYAGFLRKETLPAHVDLHLFFVGIFALEVCVEDSFIAGGILLGIPFIDRSFRLPGILVHLALKTVFQAVCLVQHLIVEIDCAGMFVPAGKIPVSVDIGCIRIIFSENGIGDPADPYISFVWLPLFHFLCAGDHSAQGLRTPVNNPVFFRSGVKRIHIFPVNAGRHQDFIPGHSHLRRVINLSERHFFCAVAVPSGIGVNINSHRELLL